MIKRFFVSMLGSIAGFSIAVPLLIFVAMTMCSRLVSSDSDVKIEKHSVLQIDLTGEIVERYQPGDVMSLITDGIQGSDVQSLCDIRRAIRLATNDDRIDGISLDCRGVATDLAICEEIAYELAQFRRAGKFVYAYADNYSQRDYFIASGADTIVLNPVGSLDLHGVCTVTPMLVRLLDKLGVKMQVVKVGTFKSAVEPFVLSSMSDPARHQAQTYVDSLWNYVSGAIAQNRDLGQDDIKALAGDMLSTVSADEVLGLDLVSQLAYRRQMDGYLCEATGISSSDKPRIVSVADYLATQSELLPTVKPHIAVYYAEGDITDEDGSGIVAANMVPDILELATDPQVRGLVLRVNSGGGSAFASEQIWDALEFFKACGKPFVVSMGGTAASGAYYISCGADRIYADRTTLTGSIGVFGLVPDFSGLVTDKLGVNFDIVASNPNAYFPDVMAPMTPAQAAAMQRSIENIYEIFTGRVADGRHMSQDSVKLIAEGRVWVAGDALRIGLVDEIATLSQVMDRVSGDLDLDPTDYVDYPRTDLTEFAELLGMFKAGNNSSKLDRDFIKTMAAIRYLRRTNPVQAIMPPIEIH